MRKIIWTFLLVLTSISFSEPSYITFPSDIPWMTQESDHFQIIFRDGEKDFALRSLKAAERAYKLLTPIFPEAPPKTWIVLADFQDSTNGYALNFPYSHIVIFASPPESTGQLSALDNWLDSVILHEYVHILHLYPAHGFWSLMRTVFGTWVVPNGMMPSHFHEGMATFFETEFSKGGRGKSSTFAMYRRKAVEKGVWGNTFAPLDLLDGSTSRWPHGVSPYFWGETLHKELWARKGKEGIRGLTLAHSNNWPYFQNIPLKEIYGTTYDDLWNDIYKKTESQIKTELANIAKSPLSKLDYLTTSGYRKLDPTLSPDGTRVAYRLDSPLRDNAALGIINLATKKIEKEIAMDLGSTEGMCWGKTDQKDEILYIRSSKNAGYDINSIYAIDPQSNKTRSIGGSHVHRLGCSPDLKTLVYYEEKGGEGVLKESGFDLKERRRWKLPEGSWVTSILVHPVIIFAVKKGIETSFYKWSQGKEPERFFVLGSYAHSLQVSKETGEIHAIVSMDNRDEVWRFNFTNRTMTKVVAVTGGINGFVKAGENFVVSSYEHRGSNAGYDIAIAEPVSNAPVSIPVGQVPETEKTEIKVSEIKSYSAFSTIFPKAWLPSVLFVPSGVQFGVLIPWFDLSQKHVYSLYGGYDTRGEGFGDFNYNYRFGKYYTYDIGAYYAPSYINSAAVFLKRWGGSMGISGTLPFFAPTIHLSALFRRQEAVDTPTITSAQTQSIGFGAGLSYATGFSRRPLSISPVNGAKFSVSHEMYFKALGASHNYFANTAGIDGYLEAPWWRDSVIFARAKVGYTEGAPFYSSYFEGGGEVLFSQGRGAFLNRGFENGTFLGRRIFNANLEYRFPLLWVERGMGLWPFRLNVIHAALVADATSYDLGTSSYFSSGVKVPEDLFKLYYCSAGIELKSDWKFFFYLPTLLRVGVYRPVGLTGLDTIRIVFGMEAAI